MFRRAVHSVRFRPRSAQTLGDGSQDVTTFQFDPSPLVPCY